jgi:hypothetical protein
MKATIQNYQSLVAQYGIPDKLQSYHDDFITEAMEGNWSAYHADNEIAEVVDIYLDKFSTAITKQIEEAQKPEPAPIVAEVVEVIEPAKEPKTKAVRKKVAQPKKAPKAPKLKAAKTPTPKKPARTAKPTKPKKAQSASPPAIKATKLPNIRPTTRFVQRFVEMAGKPVKLDQVATLLRSVQTAILKKQIRKTSKHSEAVASIQQLLVSVCNKAAGSIVQIDVPQPDLARLIGIAGGEQVYPSVSILKRYVRLQGKVVDRKVVESLLNDIKSKWKDSSAISSRDPLRNKVLEIKKSLGPLLKKGSGTLTLTIGEQQLRGLGEILDGCTCQSGELDGLDELGGDHNEGFTGAAPVMTSGELMKLSYSTIGLTGKWKTLLGDPAKGFSMMVFGNPGQGKSTFALGLARDLASAGKVLFISAEEHGSYTLQDKLSRVGGGVPNLHFAGKLGEVPLSDYQFLFVDSVQVAGLSLETFRAMKRDYPRLSIILIMQATKEGNFKGNQEWGHEVDTIVQVEEGKATTIKNRFAPLASVRVW